ncbi:MAG: ABC transporter ATP-binding protein [Clostridia bacterium]|nr:ABC transporter ATP-binding protein [Clostridia bacterium]
MLLGKHLNKYYLKYWYMFITGVLALVAIDYMQLFLPRYLGDIVNLLNAEGPVDVEAVGVLCLKLLGVAGVMFLGRMLWRFTLFTASFRIEAGLRREMFEKSERLSQRYYHETKVGSIMSWFTTDLEEIQDYTGFGTVQIVDSMFLGLLVIVNMFSLDWVMAMFAMIPMVLIFVWGLLVEKFTAQRWTERQEKYDKMYDFTQENFTGISVIKAFVKETNEIHAFAKVAKKNKEANLRYVRVHIVFDTLIELLIGLILSLIMGFGAWFVYAFISGSPVSIFGHPINLNAGNLVTFIGYFDALIWPMIALGMLVSQLGRAKASLKRVSDFLDTPEDVKNCENPVVLKDVKGDIEFRKLNFAFPNKPNAAVLKDVTLTIKAGELIGVVGRVGCGKTTIVTALSRLYNIPEESVFIDGNDIMKCDIASVRDSVAFVSQENFLFSSTVGKNITFSKPDATEEEMKNAARFADVEENIEAFPDGYDTVVGERGVTLSGGQKQRISLARAYLKDAPILILDDSVSAVDVRTEEHILENIRKERAGRTTIIIASRVSSVAHADRILVMNDGEVEAFDTPAALSEISPTYAKMVELQQLEDEIKGGDA